MKNEIKNLWLDPSDPKHAGEWHSAWAKLARERGDTTAEHRGEVWQYMGTQSEYAACRGWMHLFRHRCHPSTDARVYTSVPAGEQWLRANGVELEPRRLAPAFREEDCDGVFDGFGVTNDADPGL